MLNRFFRPAFTLATLSLISAVLATAGQRGAGQRGRGQDAANAEPSPPHDPHDLSGIWARRGGALFQSLRPWIISVARKHRSEKDPHQKACDSFWSVTELNRVES